MYRWQETVHKIQEHHQCCTYHHLAQSKVWTLHCLRRYNYKLKNTYVKPAIAGRDLEKYLGRPITTNKVPSCCGAAICPSTVSSSSLRWHYRPMYILASLMDFSQSDLPFDPSLQFVTLHLFMSVCTQFHHVFGHPLSRLPWVLLLNTWLTFLLVSFLLIWPIQFNRLVLTNGNL